MIKSYLMFPRVFVHTDSLLFTNGITKETTENAGDNAGFVGEPNESQESVVPAPHLSDPPDAWLRFHRYEGDLLVGLFAGRPRR